MIDGHIVDTRIGSSPSTRLNWIIRLMLCMLAGNIFLPAAWSGQSIVTDDESEPKSVVVYAVTNIPKGALIADKDLQETIINSRGFKETDIAIRRFITGRRAKYQITEGQIILENCLVPNREKRNKPMKCRKHLASFVQAKNDIPSGTVISLEDLRTGSVKTANSTGWLKSVDQAVGKRTMSSIPRGQILTSDLQFTKETSPHKAR